MIISDLNHIEIATAETAVIGGYRINYSDAGSGGTVVGLFGAVNASSGTNSNGYSTSGYASAGAVVIGGGASVNSGSSSTSIRAYYYC